MFLHRYLIGSTKVKGGGTHTRLTNGSSRYCGHPSSDWINVARSGRLPPLYFLPPETPAALPACVRLLGRFLVNGGRRLLSGTQITAARTGNVSLPPFPLAASARARQHVRGAAQSLADRLAPRGQPVRQQVHPADQAPHPGAHYQPVSAAWPSRAVLSASPSS